MIKKVCGYRLMVYNHTYDGLKTHTSSMFRDSVNFVKLTHDSSIHMLY